MKARFYYALVAVMAIVMIACFGGCQSKETESHTEESFQTDVDFLQSEEFRDNTIDAYYAAEKLSLQISEPEGAMEGGGSAFLIQEGKPVYFKKHLFQNYEDCWDEAVLIDDNGETVSYHLDYKEYDIPQVWMIGKSWDKDSFILQTFLSEKTEEGQYRYNYRYFFVDEEFHYLGESFETPFLEGKDLYLIEDIYCDEQKNTHMLAHSMSSGVYQYAEVSSKGELEKEYVFDSNIAIPTGLTILPNGAVAVKMQTSSDHGEKVQRLKKDICFLNDSMELETWATLESGYLDGKGLRVVVGYDVYDEKHIVYVDQNGVWICDQNGNMSKSLYEWKKHGVNIGEVWAMEVTDEKEILLVFSENGKEYFMRLVPTTDAKPIPTIRIAVSQKQSSSYKTMVTAFNKKYPAYHVDIIEDYDPTALLTELISGQGPELIDTSLIGFREHADLWMPLDGFFDQFGNDLVSQAVDLGSMDGRWYGVVTNFLVETVVTADMAIQDWTYDDFLQCIRSKSKLKAIYNSFEDDGGLGLVLWFLSSGLNDNYFFDARNKTTIFESAAFDEILDMARQYCTYGKTVPDEEGLLDESVLCNVVYLSSPEEIAYYRVRYGEKLRYMGFPTKEGATHYVRSQEPLALRKTAGQEERQLALLFMKYMLSEECQTAASHAVDFGFSVRKDVLEKQFDAMDENSMLQGRALEQSLVIGDRLDVKADREALQRLLENAKPREDFPSGLQSILSEEFGAYFSGNMEKKDLKDHLAQRVSLFLKEQMD